MSYNGQVYGRACFRTIEKVGIRTKGSSPFSLLVLLTPFITIKSFDPKIELLILLDLITDISSDVKSSNLK